MTAHVHQAGRELDEQLRAVTELAPAPATGLGQQQHQVCC